MRHATPETRARTAGRFAPLADARARLAAGLAILAILTQLFAPAFHRTPTSSETAFALRAAVGEAVVFCLQSDDSGVAHNPLDPSGSCDDHCPLCQLHAHALALLAPAAIVGFAPPTTRGLVMAPRFEREIAAVPRHALAQPRAPPLDI